MDVWKVAQETIHSALGCSHLNADSRYCQSPAPTSECFNTQWMFPLKSLLHCTDAEDDSSVSTLLGFCFDLLKVHSGRFYHAAARNKHNFVLTLLWFRPQVLTEVEPSSSLSFLNQDRDLKRHLYSTEDANMGALGSGWDLRFFPVHARSVLLFSALTELN